MLAQRVEGLPVFRVTCPHCRTELTIDPRTRRVVDHRTQEEIQQRPDEKWDAVVGKIEKARSEREAKLEEARRREAERQRHLEELFRKAQEKAREAGEDGPPAGPVW